MGNHNAKWIQLWEQHSVPKYFNFLSNISKTSEYNLYSCTTCLILSCTYFILTASKSNTVVTKGVAKKKEPTNPIPAETKKIIKNINRTFDTGFSKTFLQVRKKLLQELGEEMATGHSKSMFAGNFKFFTPFFSRLSLFVLHLPQSSSVSLVVKKNCVKKWKSLQMFCPRL